LHASIVLALSVFIPFSMPRVTPIATVAAFSVTHPRGLCGLRSVAYRLVLLPVLLSISLARTLAADDARLLAYGKHLSAECSGCHRIDGVDNGIPSITGLGRDDFIATMNFFKTGSRPNPAMMSVARSLDEEQVKALAAYYGTLPKGRSRSAPAVKK
jgi:cytochrome c553